MKYEIAHTSTFTYESDVEQSLNTIRLKPRNDECQLLLSYKTDITPASMTKEYVDTWGNNVETFYIPDKHSFLEVQSTSIVSIQKAPILNQLYYSRPMKDIFQSYVFKKHYSPFLKHTDYIFIEEEISKNVIAEIGDIQSPIQFSLQLMKYLNEIFIYDPEATTVETKARESFEIKRGVCQDYTHVMLGILRYRGIPARYVSGYLYVGEDSVLVGNTASHAWVEIMVPGVGWVGLDPTNNVEVLENHAVISVGRDYKDVSPLEGVYHGGKHTLNVHVEVRQLKEA